MVRVQSRIQSRKTRVPVTQEEKDSTIKLVRLPDGRLVVSNPSKFKLLLKSAGPALWGLGLVIAVMIYHWYTIP